MTPEQIVERESQYGRTAGILGIIGVLCLLVPAFIGLGSEFNTLARDAYAERFTVFEANRSEILAAQLIQAIGLLLFAPPLFFLFGAALSRSPVVKRPLLGLTVLGPVLYAIALVVFYGAYDSATATFIDNAPAGGDLNKFAEDTLTDNGTYAAYLGLQLAAAVTLVVAVIYTSLQAMRAGLLTRFLGTLGMALGIGFILFGPLGPLALGIYVITVSMLIAGWWRGPRPPAWETGEAIPWPKPGETPPALDEESASPEDFEGSARESVAEADQGGPEGRGNRRKRKQRG